MAQKECILIVDDDEGTRKSLALIFGKKGYETETAASGQEALARAQERFFNLALLDIRLSDMEGIELLAPLKEMHPDMVLLIVTGYASLKTAIRALNNGASGYLTKPLDIDEILAKIRDVLEKQHLALENVRLREALQQELAERKRVEEEIRCRNREPIMENTPDILIVDDDEGMRQTLDLILKKEGYQLALAETGETALAIAQDKFFNIALLDIRLPDMAGTSLLAQLKELHPDMEILLITGYATLESAMQAVAEGAYHYFIKPLNMDEVSAKIKEALNKQDLILENKRLYQAALLELGERRKVEEALRKSEARYRTLFEAAGEAIFLAKAVGQSLEFVDCNASALSMFGGTREEIIGKTPLDFSPPTQPDGRPSKEKGPDKLRAVLEGTPQFFEWKHCRVDRTEFDTEITLNRIELGDEYYLQAIVRDVTERKRVEEEIRRRNRELTLLNQVIAASAASLDPETILGTTCRELARAFDVPQAIAVLLDEQKTMAEVVAEHRIESQPSALNSTFSIADNPLFKDLLIHKTPLVVTDAKNDPRLTSIQNLIYQRGTISLLLVPLIIEGLVVGGLCLDTTELSHFSPEEIKLASSVADQVAGALARAWLDKERRQLSTAIEQTAESVIITDPQGTILYVNPAFERITGYSRAEAAGQNPRLLKSGEHDDAFYEEMWTTISLGEVWHGHFINKKKDGTVYTEEAVISPVRNEQGVIVNFVSITRDVTRELQLEEQYRRSQKMEAVGQLTGGIAHDFNNLLTAINGFAELIQFRLSPEDPLQGLVKNILYSGQRAADLVSQLLAFSRKQIIEPKVMNLNTIVVEMGTMLQRVIGEDIRMKTILAPDLWPIKVDPAQIEQVIVNLAVNARDAMPDGGQLIIETNNVVLDEDYVARHLGAQPGKHVLLAISDTGVGMSEETQAHIFEPFFTTKEVGKGTGLGLATVFGIIKQSGGNIWAYSEEGKGSTFRIYLPHAEEAINAIARPEVEREMPTGTETILLVEDDDGVRDLARQVLQKQGYTLLEANNGKEALRLSARHAGPIHLLLTDVVMPGMSGKTLAEQLAQNQPDLKIIFMSGYTDNAIAHHEVPTPGATFLQKPFNSTTLVHQVRTVLDGLML